ncbi:tRNA(Ile)-lysidine synthetase [Halalkalibacter wakoensis JCM 9140]|uniref:tRNA(Ile)-lysidine synthase n=1 Tax=Halalkalibacter wakoensis JCM 9140 TaxID=1236970 RepID=W4Q7N2_9BACI|nr:tRNA lysidine(34) synthetase TilS [Halalkalibacter wakoensis]GAE27992.1 tRNA(Ile)-lysidine synthetase [Halalkalibacter wakoensis JCM 9140]
MKSDVHKFILHHQLIEQGDLVIVATSGGPDSVALLHYLWSMKDFYGIKVAACHVHHQLRGEESDEDARYVNRFCEERGIELEIKRIDVKRYARDHNLGTQFAARELRYDFFKELLSKQPRSKLATGHHGDDQIETMLMKLTRGSVPLHTYGIPVWRPVGDGMIIRPFLGITKEQIEHYCNEASLHPRRDSSNNSTAYTRNRFRQEVLPFLKKENPMVHTHIQRKYEWEKDDHDFLMVLAEKEKSTIVLKESEQNVTISQNAFLRIDLPLQRRVIHLILSYLYGKNSPFMTSIHIEQVLDLLHREKPSAELHFSNDVNVRRDYDLCHFTKKERTIEVAEERPLVIPGVVSSKSWIIQSYVTDNLDIVEEDNQILLDFHALSSSLIVRTKKTNDRMHCRGMDGTKKIGRLFIDRKISKRDRERWPIVVSDDGQILWVPFLHRSKVAAVGQHTKKIIVLTCVRLTEDAW